MSGVAVVLVNRPVSHLPHLASVRAGVEATLEFR
jgi:hypothetical protein